jgi:hypothetical protein
MFRYQRTVMNYDNILAGCKSVEDVEKLLLHEDSDYVIKEKYAEPTNSLKNRLNVLWIFPLFILAIPFRYIFLGYYQIDNNSKLGKFIHKCINE